MKHIYQTVLLCAALALCGCAPMSGDYRVASIEIKPRNVVIAHKTEYAETSDTLKSQLLAATAGLGSGRNIRLNIIVDSLIFKAPLIEPRHELAVTVEVWGDGASMPIATRQIRADGNSKGLLLALGGDPLASEADIKRDLIDKIVKETVYFLYPSQKSFFQNPSFNVH